MQHIFINSLYLDFYQAFLPARHSFWKPVSGPQFSSGFSSCEFCFFLLNFTQIYFIDINIVIFVYSIFVIYVKNKNIKKIKYFRFKDYFPEK